MAIVALQLLTLCVCLTSAVKRAPRNPSNETDLRMVPGALDRVNDFVDISFLSCIFHSQTLVRAPTDSSSILTTSTRTRHDRPFFLGGDDCPTTVWHANDTFARDICINKRGETTPSTPSTPNTTNNVEVLTTCSSDGQVTRLKNFGINDELSSTNPCNLGWIEDAELFSGMDSIIFVGDSTVLRDFMFLVRAKPDVYKTKVAQLEDDVVNGSVVLSSGRELPLFFFRSLYVSTCGDAISRAFEIATKNSLMIFSYGPHDTSWLVFRRPMPGFRRVNTGKWNEARMYWNRYVTTMINFIGHRLRQFELYGHGNSRLYTDLPPREPISGGVRPVVVFREQYLANCGHPKYSKYPLITRCSDLLMPVVIPHYRLFLRTVAALINIPVVGIDELMKPSSGLGKPLCRFVDAGHMNRECGRFEVQLLVQAFRHTRLLNIRQGFDERHLERTNVFSIAQAMGFGSKWEYVADIVNNYPPGGYESLWRRRKHHFPLVVAQYHRRRIAVHTEANDNTTRHAVAGRWRNREYLLSKFDDHVDYDVLAMDGITAKEIKATRCPIACMWRPPHIDVTNVSGSYHLMLINDEGGNNDENNSNSQGSPIPFAVSLPTLPINPPLIVSATVLLGIPVALFVWVRSI